MAHKIPLALLVFLVPLDSARAGPFSASIAVEWRQDDFGRASAAFVELEIPLERLAAPRRSAFAPRSAAFAEAPPSAGADTPAPAAELAPPAGPELPAAPLPAHAAPPASEARASEAGPALLRAAFVRAVVERALLVADSARVEARLDGLAARSRSSAILPELVLRAARSTDQSLRLAPADGRTFDVTRTGGADLSLEARATWRLDRLVFADEELRVEALRAERARDKERLVELVLGKLFAWQRARAKLASGELDAEARLDLELQALEAEMTLDRLTRGFFGQARWASARPAARE